MALNESLNREILKRLSMWATGYTAPPVRMVILPTNRCNLRCLFCGGVYEREDPSFTYEDELSTERWIEIVKDATKFGIIEWLIGGGGEPLIRGDTTIKIIETIKELNSDATIELSTNGTLINNETAERLVSAGCDFIQIGIDGPDAETHNFQRGPNSFERSTEGIRLLAEYKKKLNKEKPIIKIHVVLNSKNYDKLPEMVELGESLSINFFAVAAMRVYGGGQEKAVDAHKLRLTNEQKKKVHEIWKDVEKIAKKKNIMLGPAFKVGMEEVSETFEYKDAVDTEKKGFENPKINQFLSAFCYAPFYSLIVDWAGDVGPCACAGSVKNTGNNLKDKSLEEVWSGEFFSKVRHCMLKNKPIRLEEILVNQDTRGMPEHPCESCGINIERQEMSERIFSILKNQIKNQTNRQNQRYNNP